MVQQCDSCKCDGASSFSDGAHIDVANAEDCLALALADGFNSFSYRPSSQLCVGQSYDSCDIKTPKNDWVIYSNYFCMLTTEETTGCSNYAINQVKQRTPFFL